MSSSNPGACLAIGWTWSSATPGGDTVASSTREIHTDEQPERAPTCFPLAARTDVSFSHRGLSSPQSFSVRPVRDSVVFALLPSWVQWLWVGCAAELAMRRTMRHRVSPLARTDVSSNEDASLAHPSCPLGCLCAPPCAGRKGAGVSFYGSSQQLTSRWHRAAGRSHRVPFPCDRLSSARIGDGRAHLVPAPGSIVTGRVWTVPQRSVVLSRRCSAVSSSRRG